MGYSKFNHKNVFTFGLGFGSQISLAKKHFMTIDVSANNVVYDGEFNADLNLLNKLDLNYKYKLKYGFSLLVGPSINVYVSKDQNGTLKIPYTLFERKGENTITSIWVECNAGIAYQL